MLTYDALEEAAQKLAKYRGQNELETILDDYSTLIDNFKRLKSDYEEEREGRERYKQMARQQERNPFVLVLVDGDGYVFNDSYTSAGVEGGSSAALHLINSVKASLARKGLDHCEVMVRVYANLVGLSKTLSKNGLIGAEKRSLAPFVSGFNRSYGLTDFVDAGELKENADFKLKAMLRLYADNSQCKNIYFAACHDVGYVAELTSYRGVSDKFTLIRSASPNFHHEFTKLGFATEELPGVFRPTPLLSHHANITSGFKASSSSTLPLTDKVNMTAQKKQPPTPKQSNSLFHDEKEKVCPFYTTSKGCRFGDGCRNMHVASDKTTSNRSSASASTHNWRRADIDLPREERNNSSKLLPPADHFPKGGIAVNSNQHRLDAYIPPPSADSIRRFKARADQQKVCNKKFIGGFCPDEGHCDFDHRPLSPDLLPVLLSFSRSMPCPRRGGCRRLNCSYGHVCQNNDCKHRGGSSWCRFPASMCNEDFTLYEFVIIPDEAVSEARSPTLLSDYGDDGVGL